MLTLRDVTVRYNVGRDGSVNVAAENVNLSMESGEVVGFVGRSGCGKTSVLNAIAGLIPTAVHGEITFDGIDPKDPRGGMAYMLASDALLPWREAWRNVAFPLEGLVPRQERRERAIELLARLGLEASTHMYPHELSQGMRQRVALARTLATDPKLILADEPFAALDAQTKLQVQDSFLSEWEKDRRTVLLVTHDLQEAILLSDRVIVMAGQPGRVVVDQVVDIPRPRNGRLVEILTSEKLRALAFDLFHALDESSMP